MFEHYVVHSRSDIVYGDLRHTHFVDLVSVKMDAKEEVARGTLA